MKVITAHRRLSGEAGSGEALTAIYLALAGDLGGPAGWLCAGFAAPSESPSVHRAAPRYTMSLIRAWPGSADSTGNPPLAVIPGVVNSKLSVPRKSMTAIALPRVDRRGETYRSAKTRACW